MPSSTRSTPGHLVCPVCGGALRRTQVRVRRHHGAWICSGLAILAMFLTGWLLIRTGVWGENTREFVGRLGYWTMLIPGFVFVLIGTRLPNVRVVRCPTCRRTHREALPRRLQVGRGAARAPH